jgi:hypothetical protein
MLVLHRASICFREQCRSPNENKARSRVLRIWLKRAEYDVWGGGGEGEEHMRVSCEAVCLLAVLQHVQMGYRGRRSSRRRRTTVPVISKIIRLMRGL